MAAYYNEIDTYAAQWLRNLIAAGHIAPGDVDTRSIAEVQPDDLHGYTQCHFFAGIGGWSYALRLAGWDDSRPVWTGSCPCQPFSAAGKRKGEADERHLWPEFYRLIRECSPSIVFGEQVEGAVRLGWLDGVFADLEREGYACGAAVLGAHSVGAPHIRQRLFWVADAGGERFDREPIQLLGRGSFQASVEAPRCGGIGGMADSDQGQRGRFADGEGCQCDGEAAGRIEGDGIAERGGASRGLADADGGLAGNGHLQPGGEHGQQPQDGGAVRGVGVPAEGRRGPGWTGETVSGGRSCCEAERPSAPGRVGDAAGIGREPRSGDTGVCAADDGARSAAIEQRAVGTPSFWSDSIWLPCTDGKARRTQPGLQPLAHGIPNRVGRLRAFGNAISPQVAAEFIQAFGEAVAA